MLCTSLLKLTSQNNSKMLLCYNIQELVYWRELLKTIQCSHSINLDRQNRLFLSSPPRHTCIFHRSTILVYMFYTNLNTDTLPSPYIERRHEVKKSCFSKLSWTRTQNKNTHTHIWWFRNLLVNQITLKCADKKRAGGPWWWWVICEYYKWSSSCWQFHPDQETQDKLAHATCLQASNQSMKSTCLQLRLS
jgi:hypothetical protein